MIMLIKELSSLQFLKEAWSNVNKNNEESRGVSGETIADFKQNLESRLEAISKSLKEKKFSFSPTRAVALPKDNGRYRPLQVPEIKDRVVIKGLSALVERAFSDLLLPCRNVSFAYQKGLGTRHATQKIRDYIKDGNFFVLEVDLEDFFGTVDKSSLIKDVVKMLPDDSINELIERALNQPIGGLNDIPASLRSLFTNVSSGIPQGNALSPLISNIYLNPFDKAMIAKGINLVRYADDFVIIAESKEKCEYALELCNEILEGELKLKLHKSGKKKYRILDVRQQSFMFLSIEHFQHHYSPTQAAIENLLKKSFEIVKEGKRLRNIRISLNRLNWLVDGWASAFYHSDISNDKSRIDWRINWHLYYLLDKLSMRPKDNSILPERFRKSGNHNPQTITKEQRSNIGVPWIEDLWNAKRKET